MQHDALATDSLEYVALTTGFCRSYRPRPVEPRLAEALDDLLERSSRRLGAPLAVPGRPGFVARALPADESLAITVSGPLAIASMTVPAPLHAFAVQASAAGSEELWRVLHDDPRPGPSRRLVTRGGRPPRAPWVAARPLLSAELCSVDTGWLEGFELDLAWAWVRRRRRAG